MTTREIGRDGALRFSVDGVEKLVPFEQFEIPVLKCADIENAANLLLKANHQADYTVMIHPDWVIHILIAAELGSYRRTLELEEKLRYVERKVARGKYPRIPRTIEELDAVR